MKKMVQGKDFFVNHRTGEISRKDAGNSTKISISNDVENFKQHKINTEGYDEFGMPLL